MKNNNLKYLKNQLICGCGAVIPRDEVIFLRAKRCEKCRRAAFPPATAPSAPIDHRKIKLEPCAACLFAFGESKMNGELCTGCAVKNETFPKVSSHVLIAAALGNFLNAGAAAEVVK